MYYLKKETIESSGVVIINTQLLKNGKKALGKNNSISKKQSKEDYFAIIKESKDLYPRISLFKGTTIDDSYKGMLVYKFKASSIESAKSKAVKEAKRRWCKFHQFKSANFIVHVESDSIEQKFNVKRKPCRKTLTIKKAKHLRKKRKLTKRVARLQRSKQNSTIIKKNSRERN